MLPAQDSTLHLGFQCLQFTFKTINSRLTYYIKCYISTSALALSALCYATVLLGAAEKLSGAPAYRLEGVANAQQHR